MTPYHLSFSDLIIIICPGRRSTVSRREFGVSYCLTCAPEKSQQRSRLRTERCHGMSFARALNTFVVFPRLLGLHRSPHFDLASYGLAAALVHIQSINICRRVV